MEGDGDTVLVIDLDDEKEETQDGQNNIDAEMCQINDNNGTDKVKFVEQHSSKDLQETSVRYKDSERNSDDDYIHVIDDDDDYENCVYKLVNSANNIGKEYLQNKQLDEAKDYRIHKRDSQEYRSTSFNGGNVNQIRDKYKKVVPGKNQVIMNVRRNRVIRCVKDNRPSAMTNNEPSYGFQYATDYIPHLVYEDRLPRTDRYLPNVLTVPYRLASVPPAYIRNDTITPEVPLCMGDYYPIMNMYETVHRPQIPLRQNFYTHGPMNRTFIDQFQRADLNTDGCNNSEITRDTNNYNCSPEMLSTDECNRTEMNRAAHFCTHRPEDIIRLDDYRQIAIERDTYRYAYGQSETLRNNHYRHAITNNLPYSHYIPDNHLDHHWQAMVSRDVYRPESLISIEDCESTIRNGHIYRNTYEPLGAFRVPCRSVELSNVYRPHLVNTDAYKEPNMLLRNAYYPEPTDLHLHSYRSIINHNRTELDDPYKNEEAIPDLSCKQETINVTDIRSKDESIDINKQRNILNTGNQVPTVPLNVNKVMQTAGDIDKPVNEKRQSSRNTTNHVRYNETTLRINKPDEIRIEICKPGVPVTTTRPDTVILSTGFVYQKNTPAQSDVIASSKSNYDRCHNIQTPTTKETGNHEATVGKHIDNNTNMVNTLHGRKGVSHEKNVREKNGPEKDNNVRFLVVFFSRVKDLVKETFPEFSKSLEKEILNLGEWTNSGRMKTDIQYICPLYCSVSTYFLPRFDNTDDDNKIEKHVNRTKICDICSCIQNCYRLYKKKYSDLISASTGDKLAIVTEKIHGLTNVNSPRNEDSICTNRTQTVICRPKGTDCKEIITEQPRSNDILKMNEEMRRDPVWTNIDNATKDTRIQSTCSRIGIGHHRTTSLNEKRLLDSLSVLNFNLPSKHADKTIVLSNANNTINNNRLKIVKADRMSAMNKEEIIIVNKTKVDKDNDCRDGNEANLILSLSYNDISKADIIATKLKDKISQKPDTAFTCHICTCTFTYFTSFVSHMQTEHNIDGIDENLPDDCITRKCPFCGIYSKQKYHNDHIQRAHPEIFTHKGETNTDIQLVKVDKKRKSMKRKFIFTCLVCHKNLNSTEVKRHREKEHKGLKVAKMFTKKLSSMD